MRRKTWLRAATAVFSKTSPPSPNAFNDTRAKLNRGGREGGTRLSDMRIATSVSTNTLSTLRRVDTLITISGGGEERESLSNEIFIGEHIPLI